MAIPHYVLISGAALLAAQATWSRLASAAIGGSFVPAMLTLSAAMAGLGLGAWLVRRPSSASLRWIVPATALALAGTPQVLQAIAGWNVRLVPAALLLALAHLPFGMILPCAAAGHRSPRLLYALGALGGAAGALLPRIDFDVLGRLLAVGTLLAGAPLLLNPSAISMPTATDPAPRSALLLAAALGLLGLLVESLWLQLFGYYWEAGPATFATVTSASVAGLSIGAAIGRGRRAPAAAAVTLGAAALVSPLALQAFTGFERFGLAMVLVGIPAACMGATFASLLSGSTPLLLAANAAGSAAAPLLLIVIEPWSAWPARVLAGVACGYGLLASGRPRIAATGLALAGFLVSPALPPADAYLPGGDAARDFDATVLPFVRSGVASTVVVTRNTASGVDILWIDRGFQGDTSPLGRRIPGALGRIPGELLGRPARRALAVGLGTGLTAAALADGGAQRVEIAELSGGVIEANRTILAETNGRLLERGGVTVRHADGRSVLADERGRYDLIVTDMMFPTVSGAGNLYSREYYALARRRLEDDGVFVHWLPCFLLSPEDLSSTVAAFLESFPEGGAYIGHLDPQRLILGLAGGRTPAHDRFALGPAGLRALAGEAAPLRDADPRLEVRSDRAGAFGRDNLVRLLALMESSGAKPEWLHLGEAGLAAMDGVDALPLYRRAGNDDAAFAAQELLYERQLAQARRLAGTGEDDRALDQLRRAAANPHYGAANLQLGDVLASAGRVAEAIEECEAAARKSPRSADASIRLAWLAASAGRRERALEAFETARRLRPDVPPLYEELARRLTRP